MKRRKQYLRTSENNVKFNFLIFIVLLEDSHTNLFTYCLLLSPFTGKVCWLWHRLYGLQSLKYLLSGPLQKWASQVVQWVRNLPASAGDGRDMGSIPGSGRSPGEGNGHHSNRLAWRIPWTEEPDGLRSMGSQRVGCAYITDIFASFCCRIMWLGRWKRF